jgi:ATP phosphoribosyltransferase
MTRRLRLAIPNKGRLVEPTVNLLRDAGLVFEAGERALVARVQNFDLDILFVRTNDIVEFVNDGVAELGITGWTWSPSPARTCRSCASSATAAAG